MRQLVAKLSELPEITEQNEVEWLQRLRDLAANVASAIKHGSYEENVTEHSLWSEFRTNILGKLPKERLNDFDMVNVMKQ